jgi:hypothetical protein
MKVSASAAGPKMTYRILASALPGNDFSILSNDIMVTKNGIVGVGLNEPRRLELIVRVNNEFQMHELRAKLAGSGLIIEEIYRIDF